MENKPKHHYKFFTLIRGEIKGPFRHVEAVEAFLKIYPEYPYDERKLPLIDEKNMVYKEKTPGERPYG